MSVCFLARTEKIPRDEAWDCGVRPVKQRPDRRPDLRPRRRTRAGDFEMAGAGDHDKARRIARSYSRTDEGFQERSWHELFVLTDDHELRYPDRQQCGGRCVRVALRHLRGCTAEQAGDD